MSKLEFKPQDRQSIDFAEEERKKSQERGEVVHKNDSYIEKTDNKIGNVRTTSFPSDKYPSMYGLSDAIRGYAFRDRYDFDDGDKFLEWVKNEAPVGAYQKYVQLGGSLYCFIIQKASSSYAAVVRFSYGHGTIGLNRLNAGVWGGFREI